MRFLPLFTLTLTSLLFSLEAFADENNKASHILCAFNGAGEGEFGTVLGKASPEAIDVIERIVDIVGVENNIDIRSAKFKTSPIAYATISNGKRQIVYDVDFFTKSGAKKISWGEVGIYAHELGHILGTHFYLDDSSHQQELAADKFAGFVIAKLGGNKSQATSMANYLSKAPSTSHPGRDKRKLALIEGWELGQRMKLFESRCKTEWISGELPHNNKVCRFAVRCSVQGRIVKQACAGEDGNWKWQ